jgi:hypothetical protein
MINYSGTDELSKLLDVRLSQKRRSSYSKAYGSMAGGGDEITIESERRISALKVLVV